MSTEVNGMLWNWLDSSNNCTRASEVKPDVVCGLLQAFGCRPAIVAADCTADAVDGPDAAIVGVVVGPGAAVVVGAAVVAGAAVVDGAAVVEGAAVVDGATVVDGA